MYIRCEHTPPNSMVRLTTVKVVRAHFEVKYENMPPNCFNFPTPCAMLMKIDVDSSSTAFLHAPLIVDSRVDAVFWANAMLVFVMVEFAVVCCPVASAMILPPFMILPAMPSMASGMWNSPTPNDPALCASLGSTRNKSCMEGITEELFAVSILLRDYCRYP